MNKPEHEQLIEAFKALDVKINASVVELKTDLHTYCMLAFDAAFHYGDTSPFETIKARMEEHKNILRNGRKLFGEWLTLYTPVRFSAKEKRLMIVNRDHAFYAPFNRDQAERNNPWDLSPEPAGIEFDVEKMADEMKKLSTKFDGERYFSSDPLVDAAKNILKDAINRAIRDMRSLQVAAATPSMVTSEDIAEMLEEEAEVDAIEVVETQTVAA